MNSILEEIARPYMFSSTWLSTDEYFQILNSIDHTKLSRNPPILPKPSEIYIYKTDDPQRMEDWKADQHRWRNKGMRHLPSKNHLITCHYFSTYQGQGFFRRAIMLFSEGHIYSNTTSIHYIGSVKRVVHKPHGNSKAKTAKEYVTSAKSQIRKQKLHINEAPHGVYKSLVAENVHPANSPVMLPRNRTQVQNTIKRERENKLLSNDDIVGLYLLSDELGDFIRSIQLLPDFFTVFFSNAMVKEFSGLEDVSLFYDTTFNLGDFYVSPLTFKHPHFEGGPVIPLCYLIHHRKNLETHQCFFQFIKKSCPSIIGKTIITDRELAITNAIKTILPSNPHVCCWNHLRQDVKIWLKKQRNIEKTDMELYLSHTLDLLDSETKRDFENKYREMSLNWSDAFKKYFDKNIYDAILSSGRWILSELNLYNMRSGITINSAESFNAVLKRCLSRKEVKLQILALLLFQLDLYYSKEIVRGYCNVGNYCLTSNATHLRIDRTSAIFPQQHLPLDKLPYIFENRDINYNKDEGEKPYTKYSVAKMIVLQGKITLLPREQVFIITSVNDKKYMVSLYPKETCTCPAKSNCYHIEAAHISIGNEEQKQRNIKLSTVMKRSRGYRAGRKKGPGNITVVEGAGDSIVKKQGIRNEGTTLLIPTISTNGVVKQRFLAPFSDDLSTTPVSSRKRPLGEAFAHSTPLLSVNNTKMKKMIPSSDSDSSSSNVAIPYKFEKLSAIREENEISRENTGGSRSKELDNQEINSSDEDLNFTFHNKLKNNKEIKIGGRQIYPSDLKTIVPEGIIMSDTDWYLVDTIFDIYFLILSNIRETKSSIQVFAVESYIINFVTREHAFEDCLQYFLNYSVPEQDIFIVPLTKNGHCTSFIFIRRKKIVIYLDSLKTNTIPLNELNFLFNAIKCFHEFHNESFTIENWTIYVPHDVPKQYNGYDCGAYCCLFVEILLRGDKSLMKFHTGNNMLGYREHIKTEIMAVLRNPQIIKSYKSKSYSKKNLKRFAFKTDLAYANEIKHILPNGESTVSFLSKVINEYWDESTFSHCSIGQRCGNIGDKMVLCSSCDRWYHQRCLNAKELHIRKKFKCDNCRIFIYIHIIQGDP